MTFGIFFTLDPGPSSPQSSDDSGTVSNSSNTNSVESPLEFQEKIELAISSSAKKNSMDV